MIVLHPLRLVMLAALVLLLSACATSHILTGTPRAPIDASQVRIYYGPPPGGYEEIAILETSSGAFTYGEQNKTDSVLGKLRTEAARLGANGILFQGTADGYGNGGASVGIGGGRIGGSSFSSAGVGVNISPRQKHASGIAIHVPDPPPLQQEAPPPPPQR